MRNLSIDLHAAGGLARTPQLMLLGHSRYRLSEAALAGEFLRPRIGWLALRDADPAAVRAVQLGGQLASGNALRSHGIWVERPTGLTVHCAPNAARLAPLRRGERRIRRQLKFELDSTYTWRVAVADALVQFSRDAPPREWLASVDSALRCGAITVSQLQDLSRWVPPEYRKIAVLADGRAASGNESYARLLLREAGLTVELQVEIPLVGTVDLLLDGWLIVEVDSRGFHGAEADQVKDRVRDGNALLLGYATVRFMPEALRDAPQWCLEVILARLGDGRPLRGSGDLGSTRRAAS